MANPDLGQHLWETGFADKAVVLIGVTFQTIAEAPGGTFDLSFHISYTDYGQRYCGTLNTRQGKGDILRLIRSGEPLVIEGRLARGLVTGHGGERYRLIHGAVKRLGDTSHQEPDLSGVSRQQRRAAERQAR